MEQREADKSENVDAVARLNSTVSTRLLPRKCDFRQRAVRHIVSQSCIFISVLFVALQSIVGLLSSVSSVP